MNTRSIPLDGQALKSARIASLFTQLELAKRAGTTATTIYRLETGRQKCSIGLLRRISNALAVTAGSLVTEDLRGELP